MKKINIFSNAENEDSWREVDKMPDGSVIEGNSVRHQQGGEDELVLFEVKIGANQTVESHAHKLDEIIYVVEGELIAGPNVLRPGDSIAIPGMTLYSFKSGANGLHYLNFRPQGEAGHISRQQFMAMQDEARDATA
jgi:mannose-6-phosphate isomerase-like protein (cupin superfamily)